MRFTSLFLSGLIALATALCCQNAEAKVGSRQLVFPEKVSLGTLYYYLPENSEDVWPPSGEVTKIASCRAGEARGKVLAPANAEIYLVASPQLVEHPELMRTIDPDSIGCISFGKLGVLESLDKVIEPVSHLTGLRRLDLPFSELSDNLLKPLKSLTKLERLDLDMSGLNGTFLKDLLPLTNLRELDLSNCKLERSTYAVISQFSNLKKLNLVKTELTEDGLTQILKLKKLEVLLIADAKITAAALPRLKVLSHLKDLELTDIDLRATDLLCLAPMKLRRLYLPRVYSAKELPMLREAMPRTGLLTNRKPLDDYTKTIFAPMK